MPLRDAGVNSGTPRRAFPTELACRPAVAPYPRYPVDPVQSVPSSVVTPERHAGRSLQCALLPGLLLWRAGRDRLEDAYGALSGSPFERSGGSVCHRRIRAAAKPRAALPRRRRAARACPGMSRGCPGPSRRRPGPFRARGIVPSRPFRFARASAARRGSSAGFSGAPSRRAIARTMAARVAGDVARVV